MIKMVEINKLQLFNIIEKLLLSEISLPTIYLTPLDSYFFDLFLCKLL